MREAVENAAGSDGVEKQDTTARRDTVGQTLSEGAAHPEMAMGMAARLETPKATMERTASRAFL